MKNQNPIKILYCANDAETRFGEMRFEAYTRGIAAIT